MHDPYEDFREVFFALCKGINTPYSLSAWLRFRERKPFLELPSPDSSRYDNATDFACDYLVYSYASKMRGFTLDGRDLKSEALASFTADELYNKDTEKRLKALASAPAGADVERWIFLAQRKIASVLGPFSAFAVSRCRFGNGASDILKRMKARPDQKYVTLPSVTESASKWGSLFIEHSIAWQNALWPINTRPYCISRGNVFDSVPKSVKTDRSIAKEPILNGYLQQGVHQYVRSKLLKVGVDLSDQSRNQRLAARAYFDGWSTLDLKSASNSVTRELVWLLFPYDWACYLDDIRSKYTLLPDGTWHKNVMFSSMGNAFTFELESLIFWALSSQFGEVSVYGDDIVCRRTAYDETVRCLQYFGFRVNLEKSFKEGNFFESCGKHYFRGSDVTPVYQKNAPRSSRAERIRAHNRVFRWCLRVFGCVEAPVTLSLLALLSRGEELVGPPLKDGDPFIFSFEDRSYGKDRSSYSFIRSLVPCLPKRSAVQNGAYARWLDESTARKEYSPKRFSNCFVVELDKLFIEPLVTSVVTPIPCKDRVSYRVRWVKYYPWHLGALTG